MREDMDLIATQIAADWKPTPTPQCLYSHLAAKGATCNPDASLSDHFTIMYVTMSFVRTVFAENILKDLLWCPVFIWEDWSEPLLKDKWLYNAC